LESISTDSKNERPAPHAHSIDLEKLSALNSLNVQRDSTKLDESVTSEMKSKESFKIYSKLVEDPGTVKKKLVGSKALQKARNWTPAVPKHHMDAQGTTRGTPSVSDGVKGVPSVVKSIPKRHIIMDGKQHPTGKLKKTVAIEKPTYTPAPPEALAERKYKKSVFKHLLDAISNILVQRISLESFVCQHGTLYGYIYDEPLPRTFRNVVVVRHAVLRYMMRYMGRKYNSICFSFAEISIQWKL
jgi:hypothetical protein